MNARSYLHVYVKRGKVKKLPCQTCGTDQTVQGVHLDYDKPLMVIWLCLKCRLERQGKRVHVLTPKRHGSLHPSLIHQETT